MVLIEDRSLGQGQDRGPVRQAATPTSGHVFEGEGYDVPTDQRWCINSVSLTLEPRGPVSRPAADPGGQLSGAPPRPAA